MEEAQRRVAGLANMKAYCGATLAQHPEPNAPWGEAFHFRKSVMLEWRKRVADGRLPHGALLAHARINGHEVVQLHASFVPCRTGAMVDDNDWQQHGRDGVQAVQSILLMHGFDPEVATRVDILTPPAVPTHTQRNIRTKEMGFSTVDFQAVALIRGVELWMDDAQILEHYKW